MNSSPLEKSGIIEELMAGIPEDRACLPVKEIAIGARYLGLALEDGACGLCHNMAPPGWQNRLPEMEAMLRGLTAGGAAKNLQSPDPLLAAIGLAAINAAINNTITQFSEGDALVELNLVPEDRVAMVGFFPPLVPKIKASVSQFDVFDLKYEEPAVTAQSKQAEILAQASIVIVTATSLVNHTADKIMYFAKAAREVCFLGPSQPMAPEPFLKRGVTLISGVQVVDVKKAFEIISAGGGTRELKDAIRKLNIRLNE